MKNRSNSAKKLFSKILILLGSTVIILSSIFLLYQKNRLEEKKRVSSDLESLFESEISQEQEIKIEKKAPSKKITRKKKQVEPAENIQDNAIGVIRVDKIGIVLSIFEDSSYQALLDGVGMLETSDMPSSNKNTTTVVTGHRGGRNEDQTFLNIHELDDGDEIKITTREEILKYKVVEKEIIEETDWSRFTREEDNTKLILMSCHGYPQFDQRLLVTAELVEDVD